MGVSIAFSMKKMAIAGNEFIEKVFDIIHDTRICTFINGYCSSGVGYIHIANPFFYLRGPDLPLYVGSYLDEFGPLFGNNADFVQILLLNVFTAIALEESREFWKWNGLYRGFAFCPATAH